MLYGMRGFRGRPDHIGRARSRELAVRFGRDLRVARVASGLTQRQLGSVAQVSQPMVSQAERGDEHVSLAIRCRLAAACGHELGWRLYPVASVSLRDSGQLRLVQAIVAAASAGWGAQLEVPVAPGDIRAADLILRSRAELLHVEVERSPVDIQAQLRSAQLKREALAGQHELPVRLVMAFPDTRGTRQRLAPFSALLERSLPITSRRIWHAVRHGESIGGDGILFIRPRDIGPGSTPAPRSR
jgi:transcriptional regulator with XRE-family HTH domain